MPFPASLANIGLPSGVSSDEVVARRAEKMRHVEALNQAEQKRYLLLADYIEQHPESLTQARNHVEKFLASPGHVRIHWVLEEWRKVLADWPAVKIAAMFREESEQYRHLRETSPFARPQPALRVNA
jgi:hypothetical protein